MVSKVGIICKSTKTFLRKPCDLALYLCLCVDFGFAEGTLVRESKLKN